MVTVHESEIETPDDIRKIETLLSSLLKGGKERVTAIIQRASKRTVLLTEGEMHILNGQQEQIPSKPTVSED